MELVEIVFADIAVLLNGFIDLFQMKFIFLKALLASDDPHSVKMEVRHVSTAVQSVGQVVDEGAAREQAIAHHFEGEVGLFESY